MGRGGQAWLLGGDQKSKASESETDRYPLLR
jgi:hypothetical protein